MCTPSRFQPAKVLEDGVKLTENIRTTAISRAFRSAASYLPLIPGAPSTSDGVSAPLPTETLVPSIRATPGYSAASVTLRRLGDGLIQARPVESYQSPRSQPSMA